jgi:excisionase family DNA binding protein
MQPCAKEAHPNQSELKPLLRSVPDACRKLGIGQSHLYELMASGKIKSVKIGSRRLISDAELQRISIEGA